MLLQCFQGMGTMASSFWGQQRPDTIKPCHGRMLSGATGTAQKYMGTCQAMYIWPAHPNSAIKCQKKKQKHQNNNWHSNEAGNKDILLSDLASQAWHLVCVDRGWPALPKFPLVLGCPAYQSWSQHYSHP